MHIYIYIIHIYFRGQPSRPGMNLHWCRGCLQMQVSCPIVVGYIERNSIYIYICVNKHIYINMDVSEDDANCQNKFKTIVQCFVLFVFFFDGIFWHSIYIYIWTYGIIWYREDRTQQSASRHNMFFLSPFFLELTYPSVYIHLYMWKSYGCYWCCCCGCVVEVKETLGTMYLCVYLFIYQQIKW